MVSSFLFPLAQYADRVYTDTYLATIGVDFKVFISFPIVIFIYNISFIIIVEAVEITVYKNVF